MLDLLLASAHHVLIFGIFGVLFGEFVAVNGTLNPATLKRIARLDLVFGILATLVLIVGFCRAVFAAKGWAYYSHNAFFWAKILAFALAGLVSIGPTLAFIRWNKAGAVPDAGALRRVKLCLHIELTLLILMPIFAAAMARGYGQF
jgi:putative membrane protein